MDPLFPDTYIPPATGSGYDWRCQRCNYQWRSRKPDASKPRMCANCGTAYWDRPKRGQTGEEAAVDGILLESKRRKRPVPKKKKAKRIRRPSYVKEQTVELAPVLVESIPEPIPESVPSPSIDFERIPSPYDLSAMSELLSPPPHLRRQYTRPTDEPMPETQIRKPNADEREQRTDNDERNNNTD